VTRQPSGRILAFAGIFLLPALALSMGFSTHLERFKHKEFCASCHVMDSYHRSLLVDDEEFLPALHYQNRWVPRDKACYTCHTSYALLGDVQSKLRGLRHLGVQYFGSVPDTLKLYEPYHNRECLHCHEGGRRFEVVDAHTETDTTLASMLANRTSCMASGCHDVAHNVGELEEVEFWQEPGR
jgi:nitrate/TMAO reductase-like tetraheme cytochrome c subunit